MGKIFSIIVIFLLCSLFIPAAYADGFMHIQDHDMWSLFNEEQQFCAINYQDGLEHMILTVDTSEELTGDKAVWIFPIPAKPDKTVINIVKGFPSLRGYDIEERAKDFVSSVFMLIRATQVYPLPLLLLMVTERMNTFGSDTLGLGVTVHESIESMGLTTELVSAKDGSSLDNYVTSKGLSLPEISKSILDEYIGEDYSFVISWISDVKQFKLEQGGMERGYQGRWTGNAIGIYITFPTDKIFYPLKPTSVYGSKKVPAVIYVLDYVEPILYQGIEADTEINYFFASGVSAPDELKDFFTGFEKEPSSYYTSEGKIPGFTIKDVEYTKIKINPPSNMLTEDLWMDVSSPARVKAADFASRFELWYGLFFFIICSVLASVIAGTIIFRGSRIRKGKLALFGLFNSLTLVGFGIATYLFRTKELAKDIKDYIGKYGLLLFEHQRKKQYIVLSIFAGLVAVWLILGRFNMQGWLFLFFPMTMLAILILIFNLSNEKLRDKYELYFAKRNVKLKIFDLKKFIFLFLFNLILSPLLIFLLLFNYHLYKGTAKLFGFVRVYSDGPHGIFVNEGSIEFLILLFIFTISVFILVFLNKLFMNKYGMKGVYILQEDSKKFWFVLLFTVFFIILTIVFQLLLNLAI